MRTVKARASLGGPSHARHENACCLASSSSSRSHCGLSPLQMRARAAAVPIARRRRSPRSSYYSAHLRKAEKGEGGGIPKGGRGRSHMHTLARLCLLPSLSSLAHQSRGGGEGGGRKRAEEWKEGRKVGAAPPSLRLGRRRRRRPPLVSCR